MKKIETIIVGAYQVNCYLLWNKDHVLVIDPGASFEKIKNRIDSQSGIVDGVFLTHAHFDHIGAVDEICSHYKCKLYMNEDDKPLLKDSELNYSMANKPTLVKTIAHSLLPGSNSIGGFDFSLIDAPGHSRGSTMLLWDNHLFVGDVLFKGSIGRTDLATSNNSQMKHSLEIIKTLDPSYDVYPGHGEATTLQNELQYNPFLK